MDDVFPRRDQTDSALQHDSAALLTAVLAAPTLPASRTAGPAGGSRSAIHSVMLQVRRGLTVFGTPATAVRRCCSRMGPDALLLGRCSPSASKPRPGSAAAAVPRRQQLAAIVRPPPSNIGVFQLAVIFVLHRAGASRPPTRSPRRDPPRRLKWRPPPLGCRPRSAKAPGRPPDPGHRQRPGRALDPTRRMRATGRSGGRSPTPGNGPGRRARDAPAGILASSTPKRRLRYLGTRSRPCPDLHSPATRRAPNA